MEEKTSEESEEIKPVEKASWLELMASFLLQHKVLYLVGKDKFNSLNPRLRAYTNFATAELLDAIGAPVLKARGEFFVFTTERAYLRGLAELKERETLGTYELGGITSPPMLLIKKILQMKPNVVHLDLGSDNGVDIAEENFEELEKLINVIDLAKMDNLYVLQTKDGYAIELPLEDEKSYAVAFTSVEGSVETIKGMQADFPGCKTEVNRFQRVVDQLLVSPLAGLILNPAGGSQQTLDRRHLELLRLAIEVRVGKPVSLVEFIKSLFRKHPL